MAESHGPDASGLDPLDRVSLDPDAVVAGLDEALDGSASSKLFTGAFVRLWLAQVVASVGDWIGLVAILAIAKRVSGGDSAGASIGLVMIARLTPGFFFASVAGVLVDRWNRKRVMVLCNVGRGAVLAFLPFVDTILGLVVVSLLLEIMTLLWSPAKEASVPNLVPTDKLSAANSLSLVAAYGTFPVAAALSAVLFKLAEPLGRLDALDVLQVNRESVAVYFNVLCFLVSGFLIASLSLPQRSRGTTERINLRATLDELTDGWRFIGENPVVRAVIIGLATGLFGGGMVVPLGPDFSDQVLGGGPAGFSLLLSALGMGVAGGVLALSVLQRHLPSERIFVLAALGGGVLLGAGASTSTVPLAMVCVAGLGVCAGAVYVVGFTILHENVMDELRGRIFATLYTVVRLCLLGAFALAPFLSELLGSASRGVFGPDRSVTVGDMTIPLPGVRLTLWLGALFILLAGFLAARTLRTHPSPTSEQV